MYRITCLNGLATGKYHLINTPVGSLDGETVHSTFTARISRPHRLFRAVVTGRQNRRRTQLVSNGYPGPARLTTRRLAFYVE